MVTKKHGIIIEMPTEARQAEPGPSILRLLLISLIAVAGGNGHRLVRLLPHLGWSAGSCDTTAAFRPELSQSRLCVDRVHGLLLLLSTLRRPSPSNVQSRTSS